MDFLKKLKNRKYKTQDEPNKKPSTRSHAIKAPALNEASLSSQTVVAHSLSSRAIDVEPTVLPQDLWDRAFEELKQKDKELVEEYEKLLLAEDSGDQSEFGAVGTLQREARLASLVTKKVDAITKEKLTLRVGSRSVVVREQVEKVVKGIVAAKDVIGWLASFEPHASLAWAGVSIFLPLLLNPSQQLKDAIEGLDTIPDILCRYRVYEIVYRQREKANPEVKSLGVSFEKQVTTIYLHVLEYQARAFCQFSRRKVDQYVRDVIKADGWKTMLDNIKSLDLECIRSAQALGGERLVTGLKEQSDQLEYLVQKWRETHELMMHVDQTVGEALEVSKQTQEELMSGKKDREEQRQSDDERRCLQSFRTSNYEDQKKRTPPRVPETCKWFLESPKFIQWRNNKASSLLWVTALPGCGKSVLSKTLIEEELLSTQPATVCYFFFKDVSAEQRSITKAMSALVHQLFSQQPSLVKHALSAFSKEGQNVSNLFDTMCSILYDAAVDPSTPDVVCLLDALDECDEAGRYMLIDQLMDLARKIDRSSTVKGRLKFIVTSRPYYQIGRRFESLVREVPGVHLAGDDESKAISEEICLVIKDHVPKIARDLHLSLTVQESLQQHLLDVKQRTYLWLHLILDVIKNSLGAKSTGSLNKLINKLPDTVDKAYSAILNKSIDRERAMKLLHIVVGAARPLTLKEMTIALLIDAENNPRSLADLDDLEDERDFRVTVQNLCGLFVTVVDSKIYLIHQTAKEFLVQPAYRKESDLELHDWKHTLKPITSHRILAQSCISYLLFKDFEAQPDEITKLVRCDLDTVIKDPFDDDVFKQYVNDHYFLDYSAQNWAMHFKEGEVKKDDDMAKLALIVCDITSPRFWTWYSMYWAKHTYDVSAPTTFNALFIPAYFGHEAIVKLLLENEVDFKDTYGRTPLSWAAEIGHEAVVKLLLENGAEANSRDKYGQTPLWWAAKTGHTAVVMLLLENGAEVNSKDNDGQTPLSEAARKGHEAVVMLLLENGAKVDSKDNDGQTPLWWAAVNGYEAVVKLLIEKGAKVDSKDNNGQTPLSEAARKGHEAVVMLLLENGAEVNSKDNDGQAPLWWAARNGQEAVVRLLLENGAKVNSKGNNGQAPLSEAARNGHEAVVKLLLENGAKVDSKDNDGQTPLWWAARNGHEAVVRLLLENMAEVDSKDIYGQTPLMWARENGHKGVAKIILESR